MTGCVAYQPNNQHQLQSVGSQPSYSYVPVMLQPAQPTNSTPQTTDDDDEPAVHS